MVKLVAWTSLFRKNLSTLNEILRRGGVYKNNVLCATLIFVPVMPLSLFKHLVMSCHGSNDASTSLKVGGGRAFKEQLLLSIKAGDIWLNKVKYDNEETGSEETSAWKCTCPHEELVAARLFGCL